MNSVIYALQEKAMRHARLAVSFWAEAQRLSASAQPSPEILARTVELIARSREESTIALNTMSFLKRFPKGDE
jgi:hypothetical protein